MTVVTVGSGTFIRRSYIPTSGRTLASRVDQEVARRRAEEGVERPMVALTEPTGSRVRVKADTVCAACRGPLLKGSSFRLRHLKGAHKSRPCHVSCRT